MPIEAWGLVVSILTLGVDIGILWILIAEFNYDKIIYEKSQWKKRTKKHLVFDQLNVGEGK